MFTVRQFVDWPYFGYTDRTPHKLLSRCKASLINSCLVLLQRSLAIMSDRHRKTDPETMVGGARDPPFGLSQTFQKLDTQIPLLTSKNLRNRVLHS